MTAFGFAEINKFNTLNDLWTRNITY